MQKIQIKNFMAIEEAEIEIDQILVLIGAQASGKSTVAKLIYFFQSFTKDLLAFLYDQYETVSTIEELIKQFQKRLQKKFYNYFHYH